MLHCTRMYGYLKFKEHLPINILNTLEIIIKTINKVAFNSNKGVFSSSAT